MTPDYSPWSQILICRNVEAIGTFRQRTAYRFESCGRGFSGAENQEFIGPFSTTYSFLQLSEPDKLSSHSREKLFLMLALHRGMPVRYSMSPRILNGDRLENYRGQRGLLSRQTRTMRPGGEVGKNTWALSG